MSVSGVLYYKAELAHLLIIILVLTLIVHFEFNQGFFLFESKKIER